MRTALAPREADDVPRTEDALAFRGAQRRLPRDDEQPLLVAVLVVVGERLLAGRQVVEARAQQLAADPLAAPAPARPVAPGDPVAVVVEVQSSPSQ
jgi:hypothetical protein